MKSICGIDCARCSLNGICGGCAETNGKPFGTGCVVASCFQNGEAAFAELKEKLISAFNELNIGDMEKATDLNALKGSFINLEYALPNGKMIKFWDDDKIYLGSQLSKKDSDRRYGIAADEKYLMVSEYGADGADAEVIIFKRWN